MDASNVRFPTHCGDELLVLRITGCEPSQEWRIEICCTAQCLIPARLRSGNSWAMR
jgi:hypothetical protein